MSIFDTIRQEHDKARTLLDLVGKTHGDSRGRRELFERLKKEVELHAHAEEVSFYKPLLGTVAHDKAAHGTKEHEEVRQLMAELEEMDYSSSGWIRKFDHLKESLLHHMKEEEHELFQLAGKGLSERQKEEAVETHEAERDKLAASESAA